MTDDERKLRMAKKREEAIAWLRARGSYVLDLKHTSARWQRMVGREQPLPPPLSSKVRKIR